MLADRLYRLTPRDTQVTPLDVVYCNGNSSQTSSGPSARIRAPQSGVFLMSRIWAEALAGGAQIAQVLIVRIIDDSGAVHAELGIQRNGTTGLLQVGIDAHHIPLYPGFSLIASTVFNAGVAANSAILNAVGILVPRGNFSLGSIPVTLA